MKKKLLIVCIASVCILTGCSSFANSDNSSYGEVNNESSDIESLKNENSSNSEVKMNNIKTDEIKSVKITDVAEDMFAQPLDITLTEDECLKLKQAIPQMETTDQTALSDKFYSVNFIDENNASVAVWNIGYLDDVITDKSGINYKREGVIAQVLDQIESNNNISKDIVYREPGKNYLTLLNQGYSGTINKVTENNFQKESSYDITKSDIDKLTSKLSEITFSSEQHKPKTAKPYIDYVIRINTEDNKSLYDFFVNKDNTVYTVSGYEIKGEAIQNWVSDLKSKVK